MFKHSDLLDTLRRHIAPSSPGSGGGAFPRIPDLKGRRFLTEYEIKKTLTPGTQLLTIPQDAIVSPLAQDWLALKGIRIVRSPS